MMTMIALFMSLHVNATDAAQHVKASDPMPFTYRVKSPDIKRRGTPPIGAREGNNGVMPTVTAKRW